MGACRDDLAEWQDLAAMLPRELYSLAPLAKGEQARQASVVMEIRRSFVRINYFMRSRAHVYITSLHDESPGRRELRSGKECSQFCDPNRFSLLRLFGKCASRAAKHPGMPIDEGDGPRMRVD